MGLEYYTRVGERTLGDLFHHAQASILVQCDDCLDRLRRVPQWYAQNTDKHTLRAVCQIGLGTVSLSIDKKREYDKFTTAIFEFTITRQTKAYELYLEIENAMLEQKDLKHVDARANQILKEAFPDGNIPKRELPAPAEKPKKSLFSFWKVREKRAAST